MKNTESTLKSEFQKLAGKQCWGVIAGNGTGSFITLNIGNKIPLRTPLDNPTLDESVRNYEGEYSLYIECVWRLDSDNEIICGAWDDNSKKGKMLKGLKLLMGTQITQINLFEPAWDFTIEFSKKYKLKVFCDQINEKNADDNYSLFTPKQVITIVSRSRLQVESR